MPQTTTPADIARQLRTADTRADANQIAANLRGTTLAAVAAAAGVNLTPYSTVADKRDALVHHTVGYRLNSRTIRAR